MVRRVGLRGSADRREQQSEVWREEVARVAPEPKDRDTFGGVDAPCLVSRSDVFPSLMQGCHRGSDPETGGSGSHGAVHSTPPGRSKPVQKNRKEASRGQASSEALRLDLKISYARNHPTRHPKLPSEASCSRPAPAAWWKVEGVTGRLKKSN